MNTIGIFSWFGFVASFEEKLKMIKGAGFNSVCTWWGNEFIELDGDYHTHPEKADKYGLILEHAHIPYYSANQIWYDNLNGEALLEKYIKDIKEAAFGGIDTLVIHPFEKNMPVGGSQSLCHDRFCRLGDVAGKADICLAVENLADNEALRKIIRFADNPYVGMCFDSGHNNIVASDDFSLLSEFADRIHALHLHDNDSTEDQHLLPYEGCLNWSNFLKTIKATSYHKSFMLEASYPYTYDNDGADIILNTDISPEEYLQRAHDACLKAMDIVI